MLIRDCAGGIVFCEEKVLLIENDKGEWSFPKGVIRDEEADKTAVWRVKDETGIDARIISLAGKTSYEFYSLSRKMPVSNRIKWYLMVCDTETPVPNTEQGVLDANFFPIEEAIERVTYSQDKSLLMLAIQQYKEMNESNAEQISD